MPLSGDPGRTAPHLPEAPLPTRPEQQGEAERRKPQGKESGPVRRSRTTAALLDRFGQNRRRQTRLHDHRLRASVYQQRREIVY